MRLRSLNEELDAITRDYDYGIVPGSATVFVRDEIENIGRLDLTLLENVLVVIEVTDDGFKVTSFSPLSNDETAVLGAQRVQSCMSTTFETMESLLMAISPMFCQRFREVLYQKLQAVHEQQQQQSSDDTSEQILEQPELNLPSDRQLVSVTEQEQQDDGKDDDEFQQWIH